MPRGYQELCSLEASNDRNARLLGERQRVWFAGTDEERGQTLGRTKSYAKAARLIMTCISNALYSAYFAFVYQDSTGYQGLCA